MATVAQPLAGTFEADPTHSSFAFAVKHMSVSTFRGSFSDVKARLVGDENSLRLEGRANVESISITTPAEFRAHVLDKDFFDMENHPEIRFESERIAIDDAHNVSLDGQLTVKGITRPVSATGTYVEPTEDPYGDLRAALELYATIDRREFAMTWNEMLPKGGQALGSDVTLTVQLELVKVR
jgi:polyisoprenoid-binding protein YceI